MKNWKQPPLNPFLSKYVDCYWMIEKDIQDELHTHPRLNPDPAGHLILASPNQSFNYQIDDDAISGYGTHMILPHSRTIVLDHSKPFTIVGIKFHVGALYSLGFEPDLPLTDLITSNSDRLPPGIEIFDSTALLKEASNNIEATCRILDSYLEPWICHSQEDKHSKLVRSAISILEHYPISQIGRELHCSQRTVERAFSRVTGLTLKQYKSMCTLEDLLTFLYQHQDSDLNWSDIAAEFGFSDQPHFIRYLKSVIGTTPGQYIKLRDLTIDIYGDFQSHE